MDRESGMFNQTAIYQLIRRIYYEKSSYAVFYFINDHRFRQRLYSADNAGID